MGEVKIEKDIPFPKRGAHKKYPFSEMEVGDSFYKEGGQKVWVDIHANSRRFSERFQPEWKFITRKDGDGVRCWRIK